MADRRYHISELWRMSRDRDHDPKVVRAWAIANGYAVSPGGRVPREIVDAWLLSGPREAGRG